eukprot:TRINITY_DN7241_c0_g1_i1.p1 TRINITY_DN7241_c0_g1~~TRINITY_DN7241_c0_g1_i1.p1  ORF type:complete len:116 (+),score=22.20 TRINITY_DN7241_c0_g1_i1:1-348(+)
MQPSAKSDFIYQPQPSKATCKRTFILPYPNPPNSIMSAIKHFLHDMRTKPELLPLGVLCTFASCFAGYTVYRNILLRPDAQARNGRSLTNWEHQQLEQGKHYDRVTLLGQQEATQ